MGNPKENVDDSQDLLRTVELPPTSLKEEVFDTFDPVRQLLVVKEDPFDDYRGKSAAQKTLTFLYWAFPICEWISTYKSSKIVGDIIGGLTIASLAVPQVCACSGGSLRPGLGSWKGSSMSITLTHEGSVVSGSWKLPSTCW